MGQAPYGSTKAGGAQAQGVRARRLAIEALVRIEEGAYANLVLPPLLGRSGLSERDRALVTDLVYGTTRMRRACDHASAAYRRGPVEPAVRAALRVGAYQLLFLGTPHHAAVSATVGAVEGPGRRLVNAVLRRVAEAGVPPWPDDAVRLSYPDWVVTRLGTDLGEEAALAALTAMNEPPTTHTRADGYVQDPASQAVAEHVGALAGERVLDVCAAPGGKATWMARSGAMVVAADARPHRVGLVATNRRSTGATTVAPVVADGTAPPWRPASFDRVLVDAPCSGLGVLRRRPDARWRITEGDVEDLAELQRRLLAAAASLVRPGGTLVYSVCTVTRAETASQDKWLAVAHPELVPLPPPAGWRPAGRGAMVLPQDQDTDAMFVLTLRRAPGWISVG